MCPRVAAAMEAALPADDGDELPRCRHLLASLSAAASTAQSFRGLWSSVASAVSRLSAALDGLAAHSPNPLASDLLRSLALTLAPALALAIRCRSPDPPAARLRTQSDIAAASAALHQLAADADVLLGSGALLDPPSPPLEAAGGSSRLESVRAEARSLVTRLQIGSSASRIAALDSLLDLLREDDKNVVVAAASGLVPALVRLLDSAAGSASCHETREKAAAAIARISAVQSCRHLLLAEGPPLLNHLSRVLESEGGAAKEKACVALQTLTLTWENAVIIGSRGGIAALLGICRSGTPSAQATAAAVLKNLAMVQELRQNFMEENGVPVLIRVLAFGTPLAQANAVGCLCNLSAGEESQSIKLSIFKEGALECLKNHWEASGSGDVQNLEAAIGLLGNLASFRYIAEIVATAGLLPRVISALENSQPGTRTEAAKAVAELGLVIGRTRKEFGDAVPLLVRMLEAKAGEEKEAAARALASLMSFPEYQRLLRKEEKGIVNVVQLLDPLVRDLDKRYAISVLALISQSSKCRKQMVAAGACGYLQRLVGMEVDGAKKLLENLGRGKILGVFPRT
ncbi:unnamed protein product [Musa acuminata subsp. malaccensis]|uniref:(wild Malaysian banana) hypothetical protein n=1 Tax=Musa acuminata subsp. malaccensis TaxID=214687 RepID=A0A804JFI0_MUSAM|nr:PREDICTED: vacuolar protein 8-like [Musa acuminata subsp. malaccensis]XP_018683812.1 PREDICTED: vacuolar protein 8-like [Musa acuminata subsp. malaccensis]XP_018683813.1 PREDICTED: vacuolar protein 8-like [Musa acuminata subsp. malaccensis]XP_018683814.1 PREDICTED: vacuolar protein 8-like [Musa acuminata subsp. malaccensis]CAG1846053.1 unnamed protein product [Musa acuminata subsp. malaccensis]